VSSRPGGPAAAGPLHFCDLSMAKGRPTISSMRVRLLRWSRSPITWAATCALILVIYAGLSRLAPDSVGLRAFGMMGAVFTRACAAAASLFLGRRATEPGTRRAFQLLTIALTLWAAADTILAVAYLSTGALPTQPSLADLVRLAGFLAAVPAFGLYAVLPTERFSRVRESLEVAMLCLAVLALAWLVVIRSVIDLGLAGPIQAFWASVSPIIHLMLAVLAVRLVLMSPGLNERWSFSLLGLSFLLLAGIEVGSGYTRLLDLSRAVPPSPGGRMLAGFTMFLAVLALRTPSERLAGPGSAAERNLRNRAETYLPIVFSYLVVGSVALDWRLSGRLDAVGITAALLLSLLLVARQGVIAGQVELRQYAALVNSSADMAFVARSDGRLILHNPALLESLGQQPRVEGQLAISDFVVPGRPLEEILEEANDRGWSGEARFRRSDTSTFPVFLSLRPVYDERRSRPLLAATAHDLTRTKQREEELRHALSEVAAARSELQSLNRELERKVELRTGQLQEMVSDLNRLNQDLKELDRLKTEFVALVSHELRTPLTNIRTGVELILASYPKMKRGARESMELVQAETIRLTEFVETILDLSSLEAGRFPLHRSELDVPEVASAVVERSFSRPARAMVKMQFPTGLPAVEADRRAVSSILFHLLDNALKYAPGEPVVVSAEGEAGFVAVSVMDHGPGVPEAERERVFEMFHRLDSSDSREIYGHGLGLHLVRRFVEMMGGDVRIDEAPGGGARIVLRLPRFRSPEDASPDIQFDQTEGAA
jgi:PAS domain S-box-containing protein